MKFNLHYKLAKSSKKKGRAIKFEIFQEVTIYMQTWQAEWESKFFSTACGCSALATYLSTGGFLKGWRLCAGLTRWPPQLKRQRLAFSYASLLEYFHFVFFTLLLAEMKWNFADFIAYLLNGLKNLIKRVFWYSRNVKETEIAKKWWCLKIHFVYILFDCIYICMCVWRYYSFHFRCAEFVIFVISCASEVMCWIMATKFHFNFTCSHTHT